MRDPLGSRAALLALFGVGMATPMVGQGRSLRQQLTPEVFFRTGRRGAWYDLSDRSTLFQDSAGTTPVTAVGDPIGRVLDKSGSGNHLIQGTAPSRPLWQQDAAGYYYAGTDGADDYWQSAAAFVIGVTDKVSVIAGVTKSVSKPGSFVCELSADSSVTAGSFGMDLNGAAGNGNKVGGFLHTGASVIKDSAAGTFPAGTSAVVTMLADAAAGATPATQIALRKNGIDQGTEATSGGDTNGNLSSAHTLYVGARGAGTLGLQGRIYQLVIVGAALSPADLAMAEAYVGAKMGILA